MSYEPNNTTRAEWAERALYAFAKQTRQDRDLETGDAECFREVMQDLLTDLMHLADANGIDFNSLREDAASVYQQEKEEENA